MTNIDEQQGLQDAVRAKTDAEMELIALRAAIALSADKEFINEAKIANLAARCRFLPPSLARLFCAKTNMKLFNS